MGKNSKAGKKKNVNKNTSKATIAEMDRAIKRMRKDLSQSLYKDYEQIMYPVAEKNAFLYLLYLSLMTLHNRFDFGKKRLTRYADDVLNQYELIAEGYVTLKDMADYIYGITGLRFELSEEQQMGMARQEMAKLGGGVSWDMEQ